MAIDFLIFALLLASFGSNLLALAAFWVTPGLRTTANRFTINLLVINLIGCLILAPTLFLSSKSSDDVAPVKSSASSISEAAQSSDEQHHLASGSNLVNFKPELANRSDAISWSTLRFYQQVTINGGSHSIVITEIGQDQRLPMPPNKTPVAARCWSIDMASALGALAVLLVVGDTWCAVTDPLRYHSRISGLKAWLLIALTWALGIFFGGLSAFRGLESESSLSVQKSFATQQLQHSSESAEVDIFSLVFACIYFVVIILLPFGFVCVMYWRIFSEARGNGLRMRQNGSSSLVQSAVNLTAHQQQTISSSSNSPHRNSLSSGSSLGGGLQMSIDHQRKDSACSLRRDSTTKVLLPTISDDDACDEADALSTSERAAQTHPGQNIMLTLQTASGEIKRNYSTRQLPLLGASSQELSEQQLLRGIRQIHSTPNLHACAQLRLDSGAGGNVVPRFLRAACDLRQTPPRSHIHHQHSLPTRGNSEHLQLRVPSSNASSKGSSYMSSLRHRLSNASSLFKYRDESRAARISVLVVIMFLVSYLPYGFLVLLEPQPIVVDLAHSPQTAIFLLLLANLSSPFIFAYRNKRVRRGIKRLFGLNGHTSDRQLQRFKQSGARSCGFLQRYSGKSKSSARLKRTGSKVSTYSANHDRNNNSNASEFLHTNKAKTYLVASLSGKSAASITCSLRPDQATLNNYSPKESIFKRFRQYLKGFRYAAQTQAAVEPTEV